jgi:predicted dehydrogenase
MRVGLVGAGPWAARYAATLRRMPGFTLSAVVSTQRRKPEFGQCEWLRSIAALSHRRVDAIVVASNASSHADITATLLDRGWPVLCEKPLTLDARHAHRLVNLSRRRRRLLMVAFTHLYSAPFVRLRKTLPQLGQVLRIETEGGSLGPFRHDCNALWDYGAHDLAMVLRIMKCAPCRVGAQREDSSQGDNTSIDLSFIHGGNAHVRIGNGFTEKRRWFRVTTPQGRITYDDLASPKLAYNGGDEVTLDFDQHTLPLDQMLLAFKRCVTYGHDQHWSAPLAVAVTRLLERCAPR